MTFQEYWDDERFDYKKPVLNGSLKQIHGDNIYHYENDDWIQSNSHHSLPEGQINVKNLNQDLSGENVLISNYFLYFGNAAWEVPNKYLELCPGKRQRNYITIYNERLAYEMIKLVMDHYGLGLNGIPIDWKKYKQKRLF